MKSLHVKAPGIWCDNCDQPCRPKFILGQCPNCGGYICKTCHPHHLCMGRPLEEVKRMLPEFVDYGTNVNKNIVNQPIH